MVVLLTNDDGVFAPALIGSLEALTRRGPTSTLVPESQRSASSMAMTLHKPLRIWSVERRGHMLRVSNGTPVDCVLLAHSLDGEKFDAVVSGVNDGPNLGLDIHYSGTVAAARKAALLGLPRVAVSMGELGVPGVEIHYPTAFSVLEAIAGLVASSPVPPGVFVNINVPNLPVDEVTGAAITRPGSRRYRDMMNVRTDPAGRNYYWVNGIDILPDETSGTDSAALAKGEVSITPLSVAIDHPIPSWEAPGWAEAIRSALLEPA